MSIFEPPPSVEQRAEAIFNRQNTDPDCAWQGRPRGAAHGAGPYAPSEATREYCLALARTELAAYPADTR